MDGWMWIESGVVDRWVDQRKDDVSFQSNQNLHLCVCMCNRTELQGHREALRCLKGKHLLFLGDSLSRCVFCVYMCICICMCIQLQPSKPNSIAHTF